MFHRFFFLSALLASLFCFISIGSAAIASAAETHVSIRLLPGQTDVKGGDTITVGIEQTIAPHWHTYWSNPGDSGTSAKIKWSGVEGIEPASIQWPIPSKLPMGPLMNFGYEKKVILLQDLTFPENLPSGPQDVEATINILVCNEICIPETHTAHFTINGSQPPAAAAIETARTKLPLEMGWATSVAEENGDLVVTIATDTPSAFGKPKTIQLYPEEWGLISNPDETRAEKKDSTLILRHKRGDRTLSDAPVSKFVVTYEDASGTRKGIRLSTLSESAGTQIKDSDAPVGFLQAIFLALLGGLVLNLMPCVFPILSMKALSLVKLKDNENDKAHLYGVAYTAGIMVCFALIAGILIALKAGGAQVGWGFQLQHPAVILFLTYLFFTLGLNLAGYFEISFGLSNAGQSLTQRGGLSGSFFTGVLATLVATPCTAPFMGVAMGYALTQPAYISLSIFMALGFGLALPYLLLAYIPALRHVLPRPGAWMETFRQFLAFPMFAAACWLMWVLSQQITHMGQFAALLGMLAIAFAIWVWKKRAKHKVGHVFSTVLCIFLCGFVAFTFFAIKEMPTGVQEQEDKVEEESNWEDFTRTKLSTYLEGNDPVFVNMTAAWCITCKVNENVALSVKSTKELFASKGIRYLKGDWTNQNPEITNYLEEYGRSGVPIYVYYGPRDPDSGARPEPVVLPQILTPGIVEKTINPQ